MSSDCVLACVLPPWISVSASLSTLLQQLHRERQRVWPRETGCSDWKTGMMTTNTKWFYSWNLRQQTHNLIEFVSVSHVVKSKGHKCDIIFIVMLSLVFNYLKLGVIVLSGSLLYLQRDRVLVLWVMLHCHVATVAQNGQTEHLLLRGPFSPFFFFFAFLSDTVGNSDSAGCNLQFHS